MRPVEHTGRVSDRQTVRAAEKTAYYLLVLRTAGPALLFAVLFALSTARARRRDAEVGRGRRILLRIGGALLFLASLLPWLAHATVHGSPSKGVSLHHRTAMAAECRRILDGYRDEGVIRPETHQRYMRVLDTDPYLILTH